MVSLAVGVYHSDMTSASDNPSIVHKAVFHRSGFFDACILRKHVEWLFFSPRRHLSLTLAYHEPRLGVRAEKISYETLVLLLVGNPGVVA